MPKSCFATFFVVALFATAISAARAEQGLIVHKALSLDMAMAISRVSLEKCRAQGYHCAITILDAYGPNNDRLPG